MLPFPDVPTDCRAKGTEMHPRFGFLYKGIIDFPRAAMVVSVRWKPTWVGCKRALPLGDVLASNWLPIQGMGPEIGNILHLAIGFDGPRFACLGAGI